MAAPLMGSEFSMLSTLLWIIDNLRQQIEDHASAGLKYMYKSRDLEAEKGELEAEKGGLEEEKEELEEQVETANELLRDAYGAMDNLNEQLSSYQNMQVHNEGNELERIRWIEAERKVRELEEANRKLKRETREIGKNLIAKQAELIAYLQAGYSKR